MNDFEKVLKQLINLEENINENEDKNFLETMHKYETLVKDLELASSTIIKFNRINTDDSFEGIFKKKTLKITNITRNEHGEKVYKYGFSLNIPEGFIGLILTDKSNVISQDVELSAVVSDNYQHNIGDFFGDLVIFPIINYQLKIM